MLASSAAARWLSPLLARMWRSTTLPAAAVPSRSAAIFLGSRTLTSTIPPAEAPGTADTMLAGLAQRLASKTHSCDHIKSLIDRATPMLEAACADGATSPADVPATRDYFDFGRGVGVKGRFRRGVFANNYVNLETVKAVGFDYDYTLVHYNNSLQELIYNLAARHMVKEIQYPPEVVRRPYDPDFAIRGLAVDTKHGLLIKLSYLLEVAPECVYRGRSKVPPAEAEEIYGGQWQLSPEYRAKHIKPMHDLFSLSEACLLSNTIQGLIDNNITFDEQAVAFDVANSIREVHTSGKMHNIVRSNPAAYINPSQKVVDFLREIKEGSEKKLFLASNSDFRFVDAGMSHIVGPAWRELFDIVIVSANKPGWYTNKRPFREVNPENGRAMWNKVYRFTPDRIYTGGSIAALQNMTGWSGHDVLYFGDSLWADLVEARRLYGWYTGAIIRELDDELKIVRGEKYGRLAFTSTVLEELLRSLQDTIFEQPFFHDGNPQKYRKTAEDEELIEHIEGMLHDVKSEMRVIFNKRFGSCFRAAFNPTQFAFSLHRYCDLYTASIDNCYDHHNFVHRRFYPTVARSLPHEPLFPRGGIVESINPLADRLPPPPPRRSEQGTNTARFKANKAAKTERARADKVRIKAQNRRAGPSGTTIEPTTE